MERMIVWRRASHLVARECDDASRGSGKRHGVVAGHLAEQHKGHRPSESHKREQARKGRPAAQQQQRRKGRAQATPAGITTRGRRTEGPPAGIPTGARRPRAEGAIALAEYSRSQHYGLYQLRGQSGKGGAADAQPNHPDQIKIETQVDHGRDAEGDQGCHRVLGA
eukprot:scaffold19679_cov124-Isochrysis_galbana.AAC.5